MTAVNPISSVDGVSIPCPSSYTWGLQDVSASGAGRTEDYLMHKMRGAQKVKLNLAWQNVSSDVMSRVLQAFNPEYISVTYLDAMSNTFQTKTFYVGDRTAPLYNASMGVWQNLAFNIIER